MKTAKILVKTSFLSLNRHISHEISISEMSRTPTRQFVEVSDVYHSGEAASDGEKSL